MKGPRDMQPPLPSQQPPAEEHSLFPPGLSEPIRRLLSAGLEVFSERGYHGATTRQIAARAGMSPAALYIHFRAKSDLLFTLSEMGHADILRRLEQAAATTPDPVRRIERLVEEFTYWHVHHYRIARVAQYEHTALSDEQSAVIRQLRRRTDAVIRKALTDGERAGVIEVEDLTGVSIAISSLAIDIVRWAEFGPKWSPERLIKLNSRLVLAMLSAKPPARDEREPPVPDGLPA